MYTDKFDASQCDACYTAEYLGNFSPLSVSGASVSQYFLRIQDCNGMQKVAAKATANNDAKRAADALESAEARRSWLAEAQRSLDEFSA